MVEKCKMCGAIFDNKEELQKHSNEIHKIKIEEE